MLFIVIVIIIILLVSLLIYSILKEREELGCYRFSISKQCDEHNSIYLINTKNKKEDTTEVSKKRLISILSYHEKAGVWRRCYIISFVLVFIVFIVNTLSGKSFIKDNRLLYKELFYWIVLLLLFLAILYFFFNYINFHHFRNLKENGIEILEKLSKEGFK